MTDSCVVNDCKYAKELDTLSEYISQHHPIGKVKHIGRMEVVLAVQEVIAERDAEIERIKNAAYEKLSISDVMALGL